MNPKLILVLIVISILGFSGWSVWQQCSDIDDLQAHLDQTHKEIESTQNELQRAETEIERAKQKIAQLNDIRAESLSRSDEQSEVSLTSWLVKIRQLNTYLENHHERGIPQFSSLSEKDWLDVTRDIKLVTSADYRKALSRLRGIAKKRYASHIQDSLKQATAFNEGNRPTSLEMIAPFLPPAFESRHLRYVTAENWPMSPVGSPRFPIISDASVDDLWETTLYYHNNGDITLIPTGLGEERKIVNAIKKFTESKGYAPSNHADLLQYPAIEKLDPAILEGMFEALTTKPGD